MRDKCTLWFSGIRYSHVLLAKKEDISMIKYGGNTNCITKYGVVPYPFEAVISHKKGDDDALTNATLVQFVFTCFRHHVLKIPLSWIPDDPVSSCAEHLGKMTNVFQPGKSVAWSTWAGTEGEMQPNMKETVLVLLPFFHSILRGQLTTRTRRHPRAANLEEFLQRREGKTLQKNLTSWDQWGLLSLLEYL